MERTQIWVAFLLNAGLLAADLPACKPSQEGTENSTNEVVCCNGERALLSPAAMRRQIRKWEAIQSPLLHSAMRIDGELSFVVGVSKSGGVSCIRLLSGHPLIVPTALESIRKWRFKTRGADSRPEEFCGILLVRIWGSEKGLQTEILRNSKTEAGNSLQ